MTRRCRSKIRPARFSAPKTLLLCPYNPVVSWLIILIFSSPLPLKRGESSAVSTLWEQFSIFIYQSGDEPSGGIWCCLCAYTLFYFYICICLSISIRSRRSHYSCSEVKRMILKKQVSSCLAAPGNTRLPSCLFLSRVCSRLPFIIYLRRWCASRVGVSNGATIFLCTCRVSGT